MSEALCAPPWPPKELQFMDVDKEDIGRCSTDDGKENGVDAVLKATESTALAFLAAWWEPSAGAEETGIDIATSDSADVQVTPAFSKRPSTISTSEISSRFVSTSIKECLCDI